MFDKTLFDRNAFDRSVSSDGITIAILSSSQIDVRLVVKTPIGCAFVGSSSFVSTVQMRQNIAEAFSGVGNIDALPLILKRSTAASLTGQGNLGVNAIIRTPIKAALSGGGAMSIDSRMLILQNIRSAFFGSGTFTSRPILKTEIVGGLRGSGGMSLPIALELPLTISLQGQGSLVPQRLGALNENVIALMGINLLPGETLTIDTDLLQVLIGSIEDVSSITNDSVFFELNPGENEIVIDVDSDTTMGVVAVWQNRWL